MKLPKNVATVLKKKKKNSTSFGIRLVRNQLVTDYLTRKSNSRQGCINRRDAVRTYQNGMHVKE